MGWVYIPAAHPQAGVLVAFLSEGCGAESDPRKKRGCPRMSTSVYARRENTVARTLSDDLAQCSSIIRKFRHWFAVIMRLTCPVIHRKCEVMCRYCASHCWPTHLHRLDRSSRSGMFKDDPQFRESGVDSNEMRKKGGLGIQYVDVLQSQSLSYDFLSTRTDA